VHESVDSTGRRKPEGNLRRLRLRLARLNEEPFNLFVEWAALFLVFSIIDIVVALATGIALTTNVGNLVVAPVLVILFQFLAIINILGDPAYVVYLARRAGSPPHGRRAKGWSEGPPIVEFRSHVRAMRRVGSWLSGGYADELIALAFPEDAREGGANQPASFVETARAIELGLVDRGAKLPATKAWEPFAEYADDLETAFGRDAFSLAAWQDFLRRQYEATPPRARILARAHVPQPMLVRIEAHIEPWKVFLAGLAIVVSAVLQLVR